MYQKKSSSYLHFKILLTIQPVSMSMQTPQPEVTHLKKLPVFSVPLSATAPNKSKPGKKNFFSGHLNPLNWFNEFNEIKITKEDLTGTAK
jgi:hypothetical protein